MDYPKYVSHNEVGAVKIQSVEKLDAGLMLHLEDGFDNVFMSHGDAQHRPEPAAGWYLIRYADGYLSFFPPTQFEQGYTAKPVGDDDEDEEENEEDVHAEEHAATV